MLQDRKCFRFLFYASGVLVVVITMISPNKAVSVPKGCKEVAIYGKNWMMEGKPIEVKQLVNFIDCVKELYKIYKTTDWKKIHSMIPQEVRDVIHKVPSLGKEAVAVAKREGLCFVSVYLLYRAVDLYDQAMSLDMDYKMYRKEFEWLQMELRPLIDLIHNELLPQWEYLTTPALRKITAEVIEKLSRYQGELKQLIPAIQKDIEKGLRNRIWAAGFTVGSVVFSVASFCIGNVPGAVAAYAAGVTGLAGFGALTATLDKLKSLQYDVEMMYDEIEEYRSLLEQKSIQGMLIESFHTLILLSVVVMFVRFQPIRDQHDLEEEERDKYRGDGQIRDRHDLEGKRDEYRGDGQIREKHDLEGEKRNENRRDGEIRDKHDLEPEKRDAHRWDGQMRDKRDLEDEKQDENRGDEQMRDTHNLVEEERDGYGEKGQIQDKHDLEEKRDENRGDGQIRENHDLIDEKRDEYEGGGQIQEKHDLEKKRVENREDGQIWDKHDLNEEKREENRGDGQVRDKHDFQGEKLNENRGDGQTVRDKHDLMKEERDENGEGQIQDKHDLEEKRDENREDEQIRDKHDLEEEKQDENRGEGQIRDKQDLMEEKRDENREDGQMRDKQDLKQE